MRTRETIEREASGWRTLSDPNAASFALQLEVLLDIRQILQETYLDKLAERAGLK